MADDITLANSLPNGLDWADGLDGRPGTPTAQGQISIQSSQGNGIITIEELDDSPTIERAEQCTITHRYRMSYNEAITRQASLGRGTLLTDSNGNVTKVLSCNVQRTKPNLGILTIVAEAVSFDTPPDDFQCLPVELSVNILKHPRYLAALAGNNQTENAVNQLVIRRLQDYFANVSATMRDSIIAEMARSMGYLGAPNSNPPKLTNSSKIPGTDMAKRAACEIITKYWRNEETPYLVGFKLVWTRFYFRPPAINPGGYREDPILEASPQLPPYFYINDSFTGESIFAKLDWYNPQCYSLTGQRGGGAAISWLRQSDQLEYQRTWFRVDRIWLGSPVGFWDPQLYTAANRPLNPGDYELPNLPTVIA